MKKNLMLKIISILLFFGACDAHMQRGLELYQKRPKKIVSETAKDEFFNSSDDINVTFPESEIDVIEAKLSGKPLVKETVPTEQKTSIKQEKVSEPKKAITTNILTQINKVVLFENEENVIIRFEGNGFVSDINGKAKEDPPQLIFHLTNVEYQNPENIIDGLGIYLKRIKISQEKSDLSVTLDLLKKYANKLPKVKMIKGPTSFDILLSE